ncbi:MAG: hypothetical protein RIS94_1677 [Pseudomonadota bacterium]|jgi:hypothetical protein
MTMFRMSILSLAAATSLAGAMPANAFTPNAFAQGEPATAATTVVHEGEWNHGHGRWRHDDDDEDGRGYGRGYAYNDYRRDNRDGYYRGPSWRGRDGRYYCRRSDGTTGLLIGGAAGALVGRGIAGPYGDRTLGAILGAAGGALLGREVDRGSRCR